MINKGRNVLYGGINEIKAKYRSNSVLVEYEGQLPEIPGTRINPLKKNSAEIILGEGISHQQILELLISRKVVINKFEIATPSLNDIFIQVAGAVR
jgi:ABC-2 type transport system ATP-binding protein